ncbi:MAG: right-handed parallel beta-helix repeat-containing protein [Candidatus Krumholzibacteriaceae bacterium]|jgi:nitrous oxidase accessory protein NosD
MKRRNIRFTIAVASIVALCPLSSASGKTWHVRQDGTGDTSSLATAIASAQAGDSILVGPGSYTTDGGYVVNKPLHIASEQGPTVTTIRNFSCIGVGGPCLGSWGFWVHDFGGSFTIRGFTIERNGDCQELICPAYDGCGIAVHDASGIVANNIIYDNNDQAADVRGSCSVVFEGNLIRGNNAVGISVLEGATVEIRSNTFSEGRQYYSTHVEIFDATSSVNIHHNIFANSPGKGVKNETPGATVILECNDFWNNAQGNCGGVLVDPVGTNGNIGADPLFCGVPGSGNFYLQSGSPCAGPNVPGACSGQGMGCYPTTCTVAVKQQSWGSMKSLFENQKK